MICPICKAKLIRAGTIVRIYGSNQEYYECPKCGYIQVVNLVDRRKTHDLSEM